MALTQGAWTVYPSISGHSAWYCDIVQTASENDAYTLKTPTALDTFRPWTIMVNTAAATLDGTTLPVDIYAGYTTSFAITGDAGTIAATDGGVIYQDAIDDVKSTQVNFTAIPTLAAARVQSTLAGVSGYGNVGVAPFYAFNLDGATALTAGTCRWILIQ